MPGSPVADIRNSFGAAFVGLLVSTTLFGLTIVQTWIYFWHYHKRDPKALKLFIAFVTVMDTLHTILCAYAVYWYLILNYGNVESLGYSMWALDIQVVISIFVGASVQLYYTRRVYIGGSYFSFVVYCTSKTFSSKPKYPHPDLHRSVSRYRFLLRILCVAHFAFAVSSLNFFKKRRVLVFTAKEIILKQFALFHSLTWIPCVGMTLGALADLLIAMTMCWSLYRRKTGYARTDSMIMTLMAYSINSGLLTCVLATAMTISFVVSPSSLIWLAFYWAMSKCYVNSLLAMLNCRDHVRDRSTTDHPDNPFNLSSIRIEPPSVTYGSKPNQPGLSVTIQRSATSDFGRSKYDRGVEPTFEVPKQDASITHSQSQGRTSESSA
ncbi:hypothetical protein EDB87DRAFT_1686429 [Lactarius vividus]|nr:hypothetical protein EDB87DRAFT_1686429 [Lactarius vividus]